MPGCHIWKISARGQLQYVRSWPRADFSGKIWQPGIVVFITRDTSYFLYFYMTYYIHCPCIITIKISFWKWIDWRQGYFGSCNLRVSKGRADIGLYQTDVLANQSVIWLFGPASRVIMVYTFLKFAYKGDYFEKYIFSKFHNFWIMGPNNHIFRYLTIWFKNKFWILKRSQQVP